MIYTEQTMSFPAKRENNKKRSYLVVNPLQGKHVPVSPTAAFDMFGALADILKQAYREEKLLLIGFAETATAVGAYIAGELNALYMQTTRESVKNGDFFYFSEQHSHATEQKLVKSDLNQAVWQVTRIVFIEDEITTGRTILNIIQLLREAYPGKLRYSAASLLNGMTAEHERIYEDQKICLHFLVKTDHSEYEKRVSGYKGDGVYHSCKLLPQLLELPEYRPSGYQDARRLVRGTAYKEACQRMCLETVDMSETKNSKNILVLGTEECMYPALCLASYFEKSGKQVKCHSTTRSPIAVSMESTYPLHERYELISFYDDNRRTFLYDLVLYDEVWIVTDAKAGKKGLSSLVCALQSKGNDKIRLVRWCSY